MAINVEQYKGAQTIGATEWSLSTKSAGPGVDTNPGIYQCMIGMSDMQAGDVYEFKVYEMPRFGDLQLVVFYARFANAQSPPMWASPALILGSSWDMTLQKISGTDRSFNWRISKVS